MKMKSEHFAQLSQAVRPYLSLEYQQKYTNAGLTLNRYRWDALHASGFDTRPLYEYLNDSHIETALRNVLPELKHDKTTWYTYTLDGGPRSDEHVTCADCTPQHLCIEAYAIRNLTAFEDYLGHPVTCENCDRVAS